ncbi:MAG: hypothetical protein ACKVJI_12795, partial [Pseudomonadales bacterium]
ITQAILNNAEHKILAADMSKWNKKAFAKVAGFSSIDYFFTDQMDNSVIADQLQQHNIEITTCAKDT